MQRGYAVVAIVVTAIVFLAVSMQSPVVSTTVDFSIYNSGWNGVSGLAVLTYRAGKFAPSFQVQSSGADITIAQLGLEELDLDPVASALIVIGPSKPFTDAEAALVREFVSAGGRLLVADDFGTANTLLSGMGATSRFTGDLVMDLAFEKQPEFSVCFDIRPDPVTANVSTLLLNYPSALVLSSGNATAIAYSSVASWRDVNGNRMEDYGEPRGPFPILARERFGLGQILLLSDPSVLINGMAGHMDNGVLAANLLADASLGRADVFFDESHRDFFSPVTVTMQLSGEMSANAKIALAALAFVLALWVSTDLVDSSVSRALRWLRTQLGRVVSALMALFGRPRPAHEEEPLTPEELEKRVLELHPDWRPGIVRHIIREKRRHSEALRPKGS